MGPSDLRRRVDEVARDPVFSADDRLDALVAGALAGHDAAWNALVERLQRVVWKAVNMMTADPDVREDAFAATWLRLAERLDTIREPEKLPGWLVTTATNEVRQIVRRRGPGEVSLSTTWGSEADRELGDRLVGDDGEHARDVVRGEERAVVRAAFAQLDPGCREIITVLVLADPPVPYDEASERLGRPIGSLGPTRGRCLEKLKRLLGPGPSSEGGAA